MYVAKDDDDVKPIQEGFEFSVAFSVKLNYIYSLLLKIFLT